MQGGRNALFMLDKSIRILNFDNSVIKQKKLLFEYNTEITDLVDLGPKTRLWMNGKTKSAIERRIRNTKRNSISFLGSGDFHHVTHILTDQFKEEFSLIVFDFHPDWDTSIPHLGCGSWVTATLKNKSILKCVLIGVSSDDISTCWIQSANLDSLKDDRTEIYPFAHRPSLVFLKRVPQNISLKKEKRFLWDKIYWDELKNRDLREFFLSLISYLPTKKVYVSIDKDCLKNEYALTNWEEGRLALADLLLMLKLIRENLDIIGMDIIGDYSKVSVAGRLKAIYSKLDHPKNIAAESLSEPMVTEVNELTNLEILKVINPK